MAFKDQGLSATVITKKLKRSPGVILNFLRLQEDYGAKKNLQDICQSCPKRTKEPFIKRMSNGKTTLG